MNRMIFALIATAVLECWAGEGVANEVKNLTCRGTMMHDVGSGRISNGQYVQQPTYSFILDPGQHELCDSDLTSFVPMILKQCAEGVHCVISGDVQGYGQWEWARITSVGKVNGCRCFICKSCDRSEN